MSHLKSAVAAILIVVPLLAQTNPPIRLRNRSFTPPRGIDPEMSRPVEGKRRHVLVQFASAPSLSVRKRLTETMSVQVLDPVPERGFFVSLPNDPDAVKKLAAFSGVRWIGPVHAEDKISRQLRSGPPPHAVRSKGRAEYVVEFFSDVNADTQRGILIERGGESLVELRPINGWRVVLPDKEIKALAANDGVKWIVPVPKPVEVDNDGVRSATGVNSDPVVAAPYSLSGAGVIMAQWEPVRAFFTHPDLAGHASAAPPAIDAGDGPPAHTESVAANGAFDANEALYSDRDLSGTVSAGDFRMTPVPAGAAGTMVAAGDADAGTALVGCVLPERGFDANNNGLHDVGETWYRDTNNNRFVEAGEPRLTAFGALGPGVVAAGDGDIGHFISNLGPDPGHATHVAGTATGTGANSAANGGAANQWKGVAPSATFRGYRSGGGGLNAGYVDAATSGVAISTNSWGTTHCHNVAPNDCYDVGSEFYDAVISGRQASGAPSGLARRISIFASSGNSGRPERHNESVAANNQLDNGEATYIDRDDSGAVSVNDQRRNAVAGFAANSFVAAGNADIGTALVNFNGNEKHADTGGPYNAGTAVYRDNDNNGTVTPGDLRITPAGAFAAGSVVAAGNADTGTVIRMFSMFGTVRVPNSAKDTVEVANISSNTNVPDVSTSRGPTADGRLKPDIAGPGWQSGGDGGVTSTYPPSGYFSLTGTSMATPAVAGSAALLTEWYSAACVAGGPTPDALRAILIHAAEDKTAIPATTGTFTGPDYVFGYGRTRIKDAVDLLGHHRQGSFAAAASQDTPITIGRVQPLKVTLAWDDPPHTGSAAPSAAIGLLQNDLDLLLIAPDGTQYTPWQLNAASPASPATSTATPSAMPIPAAAVDHRNTVEQVVVPNAMPGNWTIRVTASTLNIPPQGYTLVSEFIPPQSGPCNPAPAVDMFMRDNAGDTMGTIPSAGTMWQSPDIWNRLGPDGGTVHLNPVHGIAMPVPNYMYANVRNLTTPTTGKTARVDVWIAAAALGLSWPTDFTYVGSIPVANLNVATQQVGPLVWFPPDPTPSDHFCLYARLQSPQDPITFAETANLDTNARNSNNIIWKNVNIISMSANAAAFQVRNVMKDDRDVDIEVRIDPKFLAAGGTIGAMLSPDLEERWAKRGKAEGFEIRKRPKPPHDPRLDVDHPNASTIEFHAKNERAAIRGIPMKGREAAPARMTFTLGNEPKDADEYKVEVIEMIDGKEVGGIAYILRPGDHK